MALPREHRLRGSRVFSVLQKRGRVFRNPFFFVKVLPSSNGVSRFAVVVAKKTETLAVRRNRLRRRFLELLRISFPQSVVSPSLFLFFPSLQTEETSFSKLSKYLDSFFDSLSSPS